MSQKKYTGPEMTSAHSVKILICYLLDRLSRDIPEPQLHEIVMNSGIINHFYYSEAISELIEAGSISEKSTDEGMMIHLEEKGRMGAEYFNMYIPTVFRKIIVKAAYSYFADISRENECSYEITEKENGCSVRITISDTDFTLMELTLYAPDSIQGEFIGERVKRNPSEFYSEVMKLALNNPEENFDNIEL